MTYRLYTEDKGNLPEITSQYFDSFTLFDATGYWKGVEERTKVIEVSTGDRARVYELARTIKDLNKQESVLIVPLSVVEGVFV